MTRSKAMTRREDLRARLLDALDEIDAGALERAAESLNALAAEPEIAALGSMTTLGLPRKLHSAFLKLAKRSKDRLARIGYQYTLAPDPTILAPHGRYDRTARQALAEASRREVPPMIHQIWIGELPTPPAAAAWSAYAGRHGYAHRLWRENDLAALGIMDNPVFKAMLARGDFPGAVDVARYVILDLQGGVYLDCDWYPSRADIALHDCLSMVGLTALAEDTPRDTGSGSLLLTNSLIAAPPGHPVFKRMLEAMPRAFDDLPGAPAWWSTGPLLFTIVSRGGPVTIADARLVAANLPRRAAFAEVQAICDRAEDDDLGLLIGWKSW